MKSFHFKSVACGALFLASFFIGGMSRATAATDTWVGSASTDWNQNTWSGGNATPVSGDSFVFTGANASPSGTLTNTLTSGFSVAGVTFNAGAIAYTMTGNSITLTGSVTNNSTSLETIDNNIATTAVQTFTMNSGNITLGGVVSGTGGGITTAGTGTLTLAATGNSYTGTTTIDSGTLNVLGTLTGGGALAFGGTGAFTASNTFSVGGLNLTSGLGTVNVTGSNTLTLGAITRSAGATVELASTGSGVMTTATNVNGIVGTWAYVGTGTGLTYVVGSSNGTSAKIGGLTGGSYTALTAAGANSATTNYSLGGALTLTGNFTGNVLRYTGGAAVFSTGTKVIALNGLMNAGSGQLTINDNGSIEAATAGGELDVVTNSQNIVLTSAIVDNAGSSLVFTSVGGGTLTLANNGNTFTGNVYVNSGTLNFATAGRLSGTTAGTYNGAITIANGATFDYNSSQVELLGGAMTLNGTFINDGTFTNLVTIKGAISGTGSLIQNSSTSTLILDSANSFSGTTTLNAGTLSLAGGSLANSNLVYNAGGTTGTLTTNNTAAVNGITLGSGGLAQVNITVTGKTFSLGNITRGANGDMLSLVNTGTANDTTTTVNTNGIIGTWAYIGSGTSLSYAVGSTAGSATTVTALTGTAATAGSLANVNTATSNYAYDGAGGNITQTGAVTANTLQFTGPGVSWDNGGNNISLNGLMNSASSAVTESGAGTIEAGTAGGELDLVTNNQTLTLGSAIVDNTSASTLVVGSVGGGTVSLNGINTYTGDTFINGGTLAIGGTGQLGSGSYAGDISDNGTFAYDSSAAQTLSGAITGLGNLTDNGGGTLILTNAANTLSGTISVGSGSTLQLGTTAASNLASASALVFTSSGTVTAGTVSSTITLSNNTAASISPAAIEVAKGFTGTIGNNVSLVSTVANSAFNGGGTLDLLAGSQWTDLAAGSNSYVTDSTLNSFGAINAVTFQLSNTALGATVVNIDGGTVNATGQIILIGVSGSTSTETLNINGGTVITPKVNLGKLGNAGTTATLIMNGGTLVTGSISDNNFPTATSNVILQGGTIVMDKAATLIGAGATGGTTGAVTNAYIGGNNGTGGTTFDIAGFATTLAQTFQSGGTANGQAAGSNTASGGIDGGLTFIDSGAAATLTLSAPSSYNGGTTINGTLTVVSANANALGAATGTLTIENGGILDIDNIAQTVGLLNLGTGGSTIESTGGLQSLTASSVTVTGTSNTIANTIDLIGNTTLANSAALTDSGTITGTVLVGSGATLLGAGTVNGLTDVTGGTINGSGLSLNGLTSFTSGSNTLSGTETATSGVAVTGTATLALTGTLTGSVNYGSSAASIFTGTIAGLGNTLTVSGGGDLTVTGTNTYDGGTTITSGILSMADLANPTTYGNLGSTTGSLTLGSTGTLDLEGSTQTVGALSGSGVITNLFLNDRPVNSALIIGNGGASGTFTGSITDNSLSESTSLTKEGAGTQVLSGASQYFGGTTITGGILSVTSEDNLGGAGGYFVGSPPPTITLGGGELQTTGATPTFVENVALNAGTTNTLAAAANTTATYTGIISDSGTMSGALTVGDSLGDNGTVALTNANTYSGGTHVASGTLLVNNTTGSATGSGALQVDSQATLSGTGHIVSTNNTINGNVLVGQVSPTDVNTVNVLHMTASGSTTFSGANLTFNLDTTSTASNSLDLGSTSSVVFNNSNTLTFNLQGGATISNGTEYILFTDTVGSSPFSGSGYTLGAGNVITGLTLTFDVNGVATNAYGNSILVLNGNNIDIEVISGVPEPGTWALMLSGLASLLLIQYRRNKRNQI